MTSGTTVDPGDDPGDEPDDDPGEWQRRAAAIPIALIIALAFYAWDTGRAMQRTALAMPLHELGHATTAWWCGFGALPTLWRTMIPEERGWIAPLAVALLAAGLAWRGWVRDQLAVGLAGVALGALLVIGLSLSVDRAQLWITFGGDAGAMVLGTLLMTCMFVGPASRLREGALRYGLVAIGAAAYVGTLAPWWAARRDHDLIPFGEIEGVGLSDASKLDELYDWTSAQMVDRYVALGVACGVVLALVTAWAVWSAWRVDQRRTR